MFDILEDRLDDALEEIIQLKNEKSQLREWIDDKIKEYRSEPDYSLMFTGSYWQGKADALEEVKTKLIEKRP